MKELRSAVAKGGWRWRRIICVLLVGGLFYLSLVPGTHAKSSTIKLATLVPEGSIWDKALREMGDAWRRSSSGSVALRIYPGGVAGSETDVLRKIRIGQLHAGALTAVGLESLDDAFKVLTIPLFFDSYEEFFYVLKGLAPELERRLEAQGFVLLHWGHGGWVHFFSRRPMRTIDDLRSLKIFVTAGQEDMVGWWQENRFQPVALSPTDIMTGLQTGMIDVLPTTPLAALSLQWYRQTPYMHEMGLAPLTGATIISKRAWDSLDSGVKRQLRAAALEVEKKLQEEIPQQDDRAVTEMEARGLEVAASEDLAKWQQAAEGFANSMRGGMVPESIYDRAVALRREFRQGQGSGGDR